jgi:hypothetical protein
LLSWRGYSGGLILKWATASRSAKKRMVRSRRLPRVGLTIREIGRRVHRAVDAVRRVPSPRRLALLDNIGTNGLVLVGI